MEKLRIHHLQHVPFETLGMIKDWINDLSADRQGNQYQQTATHLYKDETLPNVDDLDVLIVLGGPMSVNDEDKIEWLKNEKEFIKKAIDNNKTVIGICLGAQLIANILGAKVYKNQQKEIGFFPVEQTVIASEERTKQSVQQNNAARNLATKIAELLHNKTVFHWHGETFDLPENTTRLASSGVCLNQAFLYKANVIGLQFHIEMNETSIENIIENCREELIVADFIQSEETIKKEMKKYVDENRKLLFELLNIFL